MNEWNGAMTGKLYHVSELMQNALLDLVPKSTYFQFKKQSKEAAMAEPSNYLMVLGCGSAFTTNLYQSCYAIFIGGEWELLDCGGDARRACEEAGIMPEVVRWVYVSHTHGDHVAGLEWLALKTFMRKKRDKIRIYGHPDVLQNLWENVLEGKIGFFHGVGYVDMGFYFDIAPRKRFFRSKGVMFRLVPVVHTWAGDKAFPVYGLEVYRPGGTNRIFWTADTVHDPERLLPFCRRATHILHDMAGVPIPVHPFVEDVVRDYPAEVRAKLYLTHLDEAMERYDPQKIGIRGTGPSGDDHPHRLKVYNKPSRGHAPRRRSAFGVWKRRCAGRLEKPDPRGRKNSAPQLNIAKPMGWISKTPHNHTCGYAPAGAIL